MMSLFVQFKGCFFSFVYGFFLLSFLHLLHRLLSFLPFIIKGFCHFLLGICFAFIYYYGFVVIDCGILYFYDFLFLFIGYLFYQRYYAYYEFVYIDKVIKRVKRIFHPIVFFLKKINAIMKKKLRRVMEKWQKED